MSKWTEEQLQAIQKEGCNILVSAGAGSGKTAVLSERVLRKLKDGISISSLLILTFTKAAAEEMKERIRKKIQKEPSLQNQLDQLDMAYITTFDSFTLSIVKKYHYLLNISSQISIVDSSIMSLEEEKILDNILNTLYEKENPLFEQFICKYCVKDDIEIRKDILNLYHKFVLIYDFDSYLDNYIQLNLNEEKINCYIAEYLQLLHNIILEIEKDVKQLSYTVNQEYSEKIKEILVPLFESKTYESIQTNCNIRLLNLPKNCEEAKPIKERISTNLKELKRLTRYKDCTEMKQQVLKTEEDITIVIQIIKELNSEIQDWKYQNDLYEFQDIAKMAIRLVKENDWIQKELKNKFNEILLDEYQDTSDLQEMLIQLFANNNVYMVGDMKQSIYRFRNANPEIFKNKYDAYRNESGGIKIDLQKNFRSRREPLMDINYIFNRIMQDTIGGACYLEEHQMVFGNQKYLEEIIESYNSHMELYRYPVDEKFKKEEIEAFLIAEDIQSKIDSHYQVFDKDTEKLRNITYQDFVILMDRTTQFEKYRKIFEYCKIPLTIHMDETITTGMDTRILYHILRLMKCVETAQFDHDFIYSFMSVSRSYLIEMKDDEIFHIINEKSYEQTELLIKIHHLLDQCSSYNNEMLIHAIIQEFHFYERFILLGHIEENMARLEYLENLATNLSKMGYTRDELLNFLDEIASKNYDVKFSKNQKVENSVHIMTIHKSKGLEFPICYYSGLYAKFNKSDIKDRFLFDEHYGFVFPVYQNGIQMTILRELVKQSYNQEEISEKIRLFYVALTRCREKMILVYPKVEGNQETCKLVDRSVALKYQSFLDIINSIAFDLEPYQVEKYPQKMTSDYKLPIKEKQVKRSGNNTLEVHSLQIDTNQIEEKTYSKHRNLIHMEEHKKMEFGIHLHQIFERINWNHLNIEQYDSFIQTKIKKFMESGLLKKPFLNIYQEYEFMYEKDNQSYHGIIDLLVEYENSISIIDYKTKHLDDIQYQEQLLGYKKYIESISTKPVNCYLYSILDETIQTIQE